MSELTFTQQTFLGASISNYNASLGWNGQTGQLEVFVAVDPDNGDVFLQPFPGQFVYFTYDEFFFGGIVQNWLQEENAGGNPLFNITVSDPSELLSCVQLIIGDYTGQVNGVPNVLNIYGYMEATGFGNSQINTAGMPLGIINYGLNQLTQGVSLQFNQGGIFGNPLTFRGQIFYIDLSEVPVLNPAYRIGGTSISLLDLVTQVCHDSSYDFFVQLINGPLGPTVKVRTVARIVQPPLDAIALYIASVPYASSRKRGQELRNDVTSRLLVGGNVQIMQEIYFEGSTPEDYNIWPFWGFDAIGNVQIGRNYYRDRFDEDDRLWYAGDISQFRGWRDKQSNSLTSKVNDTNSIVPYATQASFQTPNGYKRTFSKAPDNISTNFNPGSSLINIDRFDYQGRGIPDRHGFFIDISPFDSPDVYPNLVGDLNELNVNTIKQFFYNDTAQYGYEYYVRCDELRATIAGEDMWSSFNGARTFSERAKILGMVPVFGNDDIYQKWSDAADAILAGQAVGDVIGANKLLNPNKLGNMDKNIDRFTDAIHDLYEYINMYATKFYGIKFMARIPYDVVTTRDDETGVVSTNIEVADGGFASEDSPPLGLPSDLSDIFTNEQGLFQPYAIFNNATGLIYQHLNVGDYALTPTSSVLYVKCTVDPGFVYRDWQNSTDPRVVFNLPGPIYSKPYIAEEVVNAFFGIYLQGVNFWREDNGLEQIKSINNPDGFNKLKEFFRQNILSPGSTNNMASISKQCVAPDAVAIPLKDNTNTYGPWYIVGADGKTEVEKDDSLTPWNYGSVQSMNNAANARILESASFMISSEMGDVTVPGSPTVGLGSALRVNGPIVNNINVSVSDQGVTTTYSMRSYSPKWGMFARQNADRFKNITTTLNQQKRLVKQLYRDLSLRNFAVGLSKTTEERSVLGDFRGRRDTRASLSPHELLFMQSVNNFNYRDYSVDILNDVSGEIKTFRGVSDTFNNVTSYFSADPDTGSGNYNDFAKVAVSWDQLFVPFMPWDIFDRLDSTQQNFFPSPRLSSVMINDFNYNWPTMFAFKQSSDGVQQVYLDQPIYGASGVFGTSYSAYRNVPKYSWMQPDQHMGSGMLAFRNPMFIAGPAYTTGGNLIYNASGVDFMKPNKWVVGPLNLQWDESTHSWFSAHRPQPTLILARVLGRVSNYVDTGNGFVSRAPAYLATLDDSQFSLGSISEIPFDVNTISIQGSVVFFNPFNKPVVPGEIVGLTVTQNGYYILTETIQEDYNFINSITNVNNAMLVTTIPISIKTTDRSIHTLSATESNDFTFLNNGLLVDLTALQGDSLQGSINAFK